MQAQQVSILIVEDDLLAAQQGAARDVSVASRGRLSLQQERERRSTASSAWNM